MSDEAREAARGELIDEYGEYKDSRDWIFDQAWAAGVVEGRRQALLAAAAEFDQIEAHFSAYDATKVDFAAHEVAEKLRAMALGEENGQ
jgi:hypothetical protein